MKTALQVIGAVAVLGCIVVVMMLAVLGLSVMWGS